MSKIKEYAIKCLQDEAQALLDLIPQLTDDFDKAVEIILNCKGKLVITGVGKSGHIGAKIAATLASTGTPSFFINPLDAYHGDLGMIRTGDVVMAISNSGMTDELLRIIPYLNENDIPVIGMSGNPESLLAKHSTCHICIKVKREACPLNLAPTSSTTATLAMGDAIACALIEMREFKATDFAQFHPGGSLGHRLLTRAKDIMRKDNLPIVPPEMKLSEAITHISQGKVGLVIIMTGSRIDGIVTDGDVRRAMQNNQQNFFNLNVSDVMTKKPKTIAPTVKVDDVLRTLHKNKIHSLLVVDEEMNLLGIVDEFDCFI